MTPPPTALTKEEQDVVESVALVMSSSDGRLEDADIEHMLSIIRRLDARVGELEKEGVSLFERNGALFEVVTRAEKENATLRGHHDALAMALEELRAISWHIAEEIDVTPGFDPVADQHMADWRIALDKAQAALAQARAVARAAASKGAGER